MQTTLPIAIACILIVGGLSFFSIVEEQLSLLAKTVDCVMNQSTTYLEIEDVMGKIDGKTIERMVIFVRPILSTKLNFSRICLRIDNGESSFFFKYGGSVGELRGDVFKNDVWKNLKEDEYGVLVLSKDTRGIFCMVAHVSNLNLHLGSDVSIFIVPEEGFTTHVNLNIPFMASSTVIRLNA
ncbi:MAG: hypothetical protein DRN03_04850 [Thermoplasmata archaeon]|nr:MAG: hypothetical protein DRN03_04850 [Thermoplasmata archaeon]